MSARQNARRPGGDAAGAASATPARDGAGARPGGPNSGQAAPEVFRTGGPVVVWWVWLVFAAANLADLAAQGRSHFSAVVAAVIVLVTGVAYAAGLRPRILADGGGLTVRNPLRDHRVPWGAVSSVELVDTLRVRCRQPGGRDLVLHSWAVQSSPRARLKADVRGQREERRLGQRAPAYGRAPQEARRLEKLTAAEVIRRQVEARAAAAREQGETSGAPRSAWAWPSIAAMAVPALVLLAVILA